MSADKNKQKAAAVHEVAEALGLRADFVEAAELTGAEQTDILCFQHKRRRLAFLFNAAGLAGVGGIAASVLTFGLSPTAVAGAAIATGLSIAAMMTAGIKRDRVPDKRESVQARAEANLFRAYHAQRPAPAA